MRIHTNFAQNKFKNSCFTVICVISLPYQKQTAMKNTTDPKKALKKHFKANLTPTKFNLLNAFENEYKEAVKDYRGDNIDDCEAGTVVIDKYMNMDTDVFNSDDLDEIIDKVDEQRYAK